MTDTGIFNPGGTAANVVESPNFAQVWAANGLPVGGDVKP